MAATASQLVDLGLILLSKHTTTDVKNGIHRSPAWHSEIKILWRTLHKIEYTRSWLEIQLRAQSDSILFRNMAIADNALYQGQS